KALQSAQRGAKNKDIEALELYFSSVNFNSEEKIKAVTNIYDNLSVKEFTTSLINEYYNNALVYLSDLSVNDDRKIILKKYSDKLMNRNF
ncbi:MAG: polyprenyl synthetase family protein, partial [Bacteroidetes bacterium]|nr:polyprenyl synthetase family protein [Bacteroidota bacterium]